MNQIPTISTLILLGACALVALILLLIWEHLKFKAYLYGKFKNVAVIGFILVWLGWDED